MPMLAPRIALRYTFAKKSHSAVGVISAMSMAGVAVATAAIVIVLSVFNGFTQLASSRLSAIDPEVKIVPSSGKTFANGDSLAAALQRLPEVAVALPIVQDRGLAINGQLQMPVRFKGMPASYPEVSGLEGSIIDGGFAPAGYADRLGAVSSVGVAIDINARPGMPFSVYVPRRKGRINPAAPHTAFRGEDLMAMGVMQVDQPEYDKDLVLIPLESARRLLEYTTEASAIEVSTAPGYSDSQAIEAIQKAMGDSAKALGRHQQEESSFRMIMVEKWVTFLMLAFILVIASFNIVSTLSLMVIEKRGNMETLRWMGATRAFTQNVFMWQGWLITLTGGLAGILLGTTLSLAQQWGGFIKLAGDPAQLSIPVYPVHVEAVDLAIVLGLVMVVALAASLVSRLIMRK